MSSPDVAVLGAGAAGCATAYFLARAGAKVTVIERKSVAFGASGYAFGLLNPLTGVGIPGPIQPIAEASFEMHKALLPVLEREAEMDIQVATTPHLELCLTEEEVASKRETMRRWDAAEGFTARWLTSKEVHELEPRIAPDIEGAVLLEDPVLLDSRRFTSALAKAAERHGAGFIYGDVDGLKSARGRVTAVVVDGRDVACDTAVVALGPWSGRASEWLGLSVPVEPLKGEILYLKGLDPPLRHHIQGDCAVVQKADGMVWVGSTVEEAGFDLETTAEARECLMQQAARILPSLEGVASVRQTACLRPTTPDHLPIVGKAPGWEGVYLATGAEKKGILLGPAMGRAVADLIVDGETSVPIAPFAPDRFAS